MMRIGRLLLSFALLAPSSAFAQTAPPPLQSHEVHSDGSITFRYANKGAEKVELVTDGLPGALPMQRDDAGVWSVTTPPLPPEYYGYSFRVDGVSELDPRNANAVPNLVSLASQVLVPGTPAMPWERIDIPHGEVNHHYFTTHIALHVPENQSGYVVYTPPNYDPRRRGGYPVLYLLHGWSDNAGAWAEVGKVNFILDSMIDSGRAVPMIVVMPLGYGDFDFVTRGHTVWTDPAKVAANESLFERTLLEEVLPAVEREYNVAKGREHRAIAGLSMGGLETLYTGLHHSDQFAYVAGLSSALRGQSFDEHLPGVDAKKANLRLLWVSCGTSDPLIQPNRDFVAWAKAKGFNVTAVETPGAHNWLTWRDNLLHFGPLLFR